MRLFGTLTIADLDGRPDEAPLDSTHQGELQLGILRSVEREQAGGGAHGLERHPQRAVRVVEIAELSTEELTEHRALVAVERAERHRVVQLPPGLGGNADQLVELSLHALSLAEFLG